MSFNIDDPLAGILSDESDGSFFDDDILGKQKPKKKTTPIAEKKNSLFDLGVGDKPKPALDDKKNALFDLGLSSSNKSAVPLLEEEQQPKAGVAKSPTPFKRTLSKESVKFESKPLERFDSFTKPTAATRTNPSTDKLNILDDLLEPKKETVKPLERGKSSQSLLDDILGPPKTPTVGQGIRPVSAAKGLDSDLATIAKTESKQSLAPKTLPQKPLQKQAPKAAVKDDTAKKPKANDDWLGIFKNKDTDEDEYDDSGMPAWLVGDKKKKTDSKKVKETPKIVESKVQDNKEEKFSEQQDSHGDIKAPSSMPSLPLLTMPPMSTMPAPQRIHGSSEDISAEGATMFLDQQESQLMVALQLKAQEEKLAAMQMRQKEAARLQREAMQSQHEQVDAILQRQAEQRRQMQAIIASHQERITQRIKDLLGTTNIDDQGENKYDDRGDYEASNEVRGRTEKPHVTEKKQLLQLVQSLQENHDKEIDLMETSYRRQLAFFELSVNQSEERMKEESEKLVKYYSEKIVWLEEHHQLYKKMTEENMASLTERHKAENEMLRQQHLENIKILQEHHAALLENIKNAVKQEQVLIKDSAGFSSDLVELIGDVKESRSQCQILIEKVQSLVENTNVNGEKSLQVRETQINDMIQQLKKERENFEVEKIENREMVKMLESRLRQMTTMIEEETASLKQKRMEFEFEKATFSKQTEFAKNVLKKQDEEIKTLREYIQKEYQAKIAKIDEEKAKALKDAAAIAKEKASIQNLKQELEKTKAELHAQLEEVSEERSKMNLEKQQMHMEEQRILAKSRDLDLLAKTAIEKQTQADKKYAEAELILKKYEDRIRRMQEHAVSLNAREKQIAKEKVALSRERLSLHNERKQLEGRQHCSLCRPQPAVQYGIEPTYTLPEPFMNAPISREYGTSNRANYAMNAIEQEMAHLMSRNFGIRPTTGFGSIQEDRIDDRHVFDESNFHTTQSTQVESGTFKDYMDPKFMMLRLDVQQVLSNIEQRKKEVDEQTENLDQEPTSEKD